eukprot:CCRYP_000799-RA/>CCRYP_000799-RA protein AED:0.13 eAED:0.13 QI:384/0/0.5/1/1/1/2/0/552
MPPFFDERGDPALSPFTVLNLPTTATEPEIKKAYRTAMLQLHPDKLPANLSESEIAAVTEKFHNVKDAYEFLTNPQYLTARRLYQAKMASRRAEYERREAFLRRAGSSTTTGTAAWSTRTRMTEAAAPPSYYKMPDKRSAAYKTNNNNNYAPPQYSRYYNTTTTASHAVDPTRYHSRSKSRNAPRSTRTRAGYASDGNVRTTKSFRETSTSAYHRGSGPRKTRRSADHPPPPQTTRPGRSDKYQPPKEDMAADPRRTRAKSEPRRRHKSRDCGGSGTTTAESGDDRARFDDRKDESHVYVKKRSNGVGGGKTSFHTTATANPNSNARRETSFQNSTNTRRTAPPATGRGRQAHSSSSPSSQRQRQRYRAKSAPARCSAPEKKNHSNGNNNNNNKASSDNGNSNSNNNNNKLPKEFYCPLSKRIMKDPVVDPDGNAYEREAIERWLRVQSSSPITNGFLTVEMLRPSKDLKSRIYKVVAPNPNSPSPSTEWESAPSPTEKSPSSSRYPSYPTRDSWSTVPSTHAPSIGRCSPEKSTLGTNGLPTSSPPRVCRT